MIRIVMACSIQSPKYLYRDLEIRNHPKYSIVVIGQNTKKSPGAMIRLAVKQTPAKNYPLTLVGKTLQCAK